MDLTALIQTYGYGIVLLGTVLEGETVLILAGFAAHRGYLHLPLVIVTATVGGFLGDQGYFLLGRRFGDRLFHRFPTLESGTTRFTQLLNRHSVLVILSLRFLYGLRTVGPVAVGMSTVSWQRFLVLNLLGAIFWSAVFASLGYAFGNLAEALLGEVKEVEKWIFVAILLVGITTALLYRSRRSSVSRSLGERVGE
ncbi:MAG: DedA family protein [Deltaproteobacteria bacterium]|nr:DedA family protein [Deltaproteobacteria bacterium]